MKIIKKKNTLGISRYRDRDRYILWVYKLKQRRNNNEWLCRIRRVYFYYCHLGALHSVGNCSENVLK